MLRKLGKQILLLSIPLFVLLLIYYNHGHIVKRDDHSDNKNNDVSEFSVPHQVELVPSVHLPKEVSEQQWRVLTDGTVIHQGVEDSGRKMSIVLNNVHQCASLRPNESSFVVVVESNISNFQERQLIRETWALSILQQLANYRVIFLVGLSLDPDVQNKLDFENLIYEDVVQIGVYEDFQNLTHKSIHLLYWYSTFCANAHYIFKTDDDIYLHIPNLVNMFKSNVSLEGTILCHHNKSRKILRNLSDMHHLIYSLKSANRPEVITQIRKKFRKYLISFKKLPGSFYPDYCSGFGYTLNVGVAQKLLQASAKIPYIGIEDVFVTGFCRQKANITITDSEHFTLKPTIQPIESKCAFENGRITSNEMSMEEIRKVWIHINTQGYYCKLSANNSNS